jgi:hypothetical protein
MKSVLLISASVLVLTTAAYAAGAGSLTITEAEAAEVKLRLEAYEKGVLSLEDLNDGTQKLVAYYLAYASSVPTKAKLPLSCAFGRYDLHAAATRLAADYVSVYSNDWRGWRVLGFAHTQMDNVKAAIAAYTNAVRLGDKDSCGMLAANAIDDHQLELVNGLVPDMLKLQHDSTTSKLYWMELTGVLVLYSVKADREDVFLKAMEGADLEAILSRKELKGYVERACKKFKSEEAQRIAEKLRRASSGKGGSEN